MSSSEVQTGNSSQQINEGVNGVTSHHLVEADDDGVGVVDTMDGENDTLKVTSMMTHDGAHSIDHTSLQDEVHYVTTDESGHAVTVVYPQSALPLLRTSDGSLVNFVELPGVHGELGLDQGELGGEAGMVLQQDFTGEGPITVVTADDTGEQLALLDQQHGHSGVTMTGGEGGQSITYLTAAEDTADGSPSAILGEQLIQIPASDQSGSTHTITLPLSFLNDGTGVSILQGLGHLQLPLVGETGGDSITLTSPVDSDNIASVGGADVSHSRVLSVLQSSAVPTTASGTFSVITSQSTIQNDHNELSSASQIHVPISTSRPHNSSSTKPFVFKTSSHVSGKQNSSHQPRKLIGSGPLAISAQGFVQKIGNRMVTVLPRPEDLKKLRESKSLILSIKGSGDSDAYGSKSSRARKVPVPVRPHQRYGRRGRGGGRGRPPSVSRAEVKVDKEQIAKTVSLLKKEVPGDSILLAETSGDHHLDGFIKLEDSTSEGIVVDMTLPGGSPASAVLVKGPPEDEEFILSNIDPPTPVMSRRGRRKKRGRGRPRGTYVISSSGRRPGRPKKVETLLEGPHGARMIHTGPDTRLDGELDHQENELVETVPTIELAGEEGSDGLQELRVLEMGALKQEPIDIEIKKEEEVDPNRRKLPPRRRGARYEKMIQALKKRENDDDDFSMGEEEDISPDYLTYRRPPPPPKTRGTSGPGKRGRPRKHWPPPPVIKVEPGTEQHLLGGPLDASHMTQVTARDLVTSMTEGDLTEAEKHNLLITFQRPETGEVVITMLPPPPAAQQQDDFQDHTTTEGTQTEEDIELPTDDGNVDCHKCEECGDVIQFKRDYIRHLRQKHDLRPFECNQCGKTCTSHTALEAHHRVHGLERPHRCDYCGKGFVDPSHLKTHILTHTGERPHRCHHCLKAFAQASQLKKHLAIHEDSHQFKCSVCSRTFAHRDTLYTHMKTHTSNRPFICDICSLGFVTSSGLNRHRKVHKRSSNPVEGLDNELKCTVCQANFTYKRTLTKHMSTVHGDGILVKEENESVVKSFPSEVSIVEQLQEQLNEGYAPKTSELYDEPKQSETLESKFPVNPFKCGICEESFTDVDVLCDHYTNSHTGDQEVYCDVCSVGCATDQQLEQHKQLHLFEEQQSMIHTIPTEEFPFVCPVCGKSFRKHQEFVRHHRAHTHEKSYKCELCGAGFPLKSALDKHVLVHTGERPFKCDICLKSFRQSAALVRHKLWTHRLKNQNKCELCGKTFFTPALLSYHLDSHGDAGQSVKSRLAETSETEEQQLLEQCHSVKQENRGGGEVYGDARGDGQHGCEYCGKNFSSYVLLLTHKLTHKLSASYKCDVCHRTFREKRYLQKHKLTHKGVKSWKCDICKKAFATKLTLIRHSHVHLREALRPGPELPFIPEEGEDGGEIITGSTLPAVLKCDECGIDFAHKSHFVRHKLLHSGTPLLKCGLCNKLFVHKSDIIRHKVMHSFMFTCDVCGRNFHKRSLFIMHKKKHIDDKPFKCECGKSFSTSGNYNTHKRIHSGEKPYKCDMCDYRCSQSGRLLKHKRMHSGEKPYQCETCGKYFANYESVKIHMRIHTGERPFKCGNCGKTFINNGSLNLHMRDHIREEMFKCDVCNHKFRREHHLEKHRQFHHFQQQYQNAVMGLETDGSVEAHLYMCEVCGRVFDKKKYLYTHHNVHSRQRNFPCTYCGKQLASRLALKNHHLIHTGEMPFKCSQCDKEFRSSSNLKRHERSHPVQDVNALRCDECDESFYSPELLNQHKASHMQGMMMMNPGVESVTTADNSHHLYVFETVGEVGEAMDSTQQLLVDNSQQQFLVDGSQPLLVFPEAANTPYSELTEAPDPEQEEAEVEHVPPPEVIMVHEKMDEREEEEERVVEKPFRCDDCGKSFAKKQYLTKHKYRHREVKPHACDVCGKRFAQKFEVAVHKIKHTGERPHKCDVCHKPFRSKVNLLNHKMRHTGEYPFLCSVCSKGFSTQLQLERHVTLHTGSHPYKCSICQRGYTQRTTLIKHLAKAHDILDVSQIEAMDSLENVEAVENMESMEEVEGVEKSMFSNVHETAMEVNEQATVEEDEHTAITMDTDILAHGEQQAAYSVVEVHPDYLKDYLMAGPQVVATHDMDPKLLQSILQQVRNSQDETDGQAVVHVNAIDG
ncbi:zinc finger protein Xfin-like [Homarus americanus]|uniref:zinc finger protein Xfin-like n=1 Tax=Homarus americanus TaxID=6706 RepID=UPI001C483345|nr:zinc finger protein Xfin-like [Homarus americanus]